MRTGVAVTGAVPGGGFRNRSGSSAGTAIAAGGCALLMRWISDQPGAQEEQVQARSETLS